MRLIIIVLTTLLVRSAFSGEPESSAAAPSTELADLRRQIDELRKAQTKPSVIKSSTDRVLDNKYGPNASVTTKAGKLTINAMVQAWYYSIENDNHSLFDDPDVNGVSDTGEAIDNDSFRIRRTELRFTLDLNEHITAVIMLDPAREAVSFPSFSANTGLVKRGTNVNVANVQTGAGSVPRLLQDAYILYHDVVPHHNFQIGQFKPFFGDEGLRSSGRLDFVERSFIGQIGDARDLGASIHGTWLNDRVQYWLGVYDAAGNFHGSAGQQQNRSDDNDEKDLSYRVLVRPVWNEKTWGSLELGGSSQFGIHGESSGSDPVGSPINGLNRNQTSAIRHSAWAYYAPGAALKGWWLRGEWASFKDRHAPSSVIDLLGNGSSGNGNTQTDGKPFTVQGWYASTGYHLGESALRDSLPGPLRSFEFALRYESFQNVHAADLNNPSHTDVFSTRVWTAGINYYISGHNAKIQINYNIVNNPDGRDNSGARNFQQDVKNNSVLVNFQVAL